MGGSQNFIESLRQVSVHGRDGCYLLTLIDMVKTGPAKGTRRRKPLTYEQTSKVLEKAAAMARALGTQEEEQWL